jgi:hypothetical protein
MKGLHFVMCAELDQLPLLCHVTEHTNFPQGCDAVKSDMYRYFLQYAATACGGRSVCSFLRGKSRICLRNVCETLHHITHYNTLIFQQPSQINLFLG